MEEFAIILSIPAAFIGSVVYCFILAKLNLLPGPFRSLRRLMWITSVGVLLLYVIEIILLLTIGAIRSRAIIGPGFYVAHVLIFFLGTPALANVLILRNSKSWFRWYWAVPLCTFFALSLVLLQYDVSEALYGVDGTEGPYSYWQSPASGATQKLVTAAQKVCWDSKSPLPKHEET